MRLNKRQTYHLRELIKCYDTKEKLDIYDVFGILARIDSNCAECKEIVYLLLKDLRRY